VNSIDPETAEDIESNLKEDRITSASGTVAKSDYLVVELHSEGTTGVLQEAIARTDEVPADHLLDRDDDDITMSWTLGTGDLVQSEAVMRSWDEDVTISLSQGRVIGVPREDGYNFERFYLLLQLEEGTSLTTSDYDLQTPANLTVQVETAAPHPSLPDRDFSFVEPLAEIDKKRANWNSAEDRIEVPPEENVTIPGVTNVAAGTNLTVQVNSVAGQESVFFVLESGIYPTHDTNRGTQLWELQVEDAFATASAGTEFEIRIRRQGAAGKINPGTAIDGLVIEGGGTGGGGGDSGTLLQNSKSVVEELESATQRVDIQFEEFVSGSVDVTALESRPAGVSAPPGDAISTLDIRVPPSARDHPATIRLTIDRQALEDRGSSPESLTVYRYVESTARNEEVPSTVESVTEDTVELRINAPGFSVFTVVTTKTATATPTAQQTASSSPTATVSATAASTNHEQPATGSLTGTERPNPGGTPGTETTTAGSSGFGAVIAMAVIVAVTVLARRQF
jgi:hypothetical protein